MISIDPVEAFWLTLNGITLVLTLVALFAAYQQRRIITGLSDKATAIVALGTLRREVLRASIQVVLLLIAIPSIFDNRETKLTPILVLFLLVPVGVFLNSIGDMIDRIKLARIVTEDLISERERSFARLEALIRENTQITQVAAEKADAAYTEVMRRRP